MFDCGTPEDFRCGFDVSSMFQSGALYINRHAFERSRSSHQNNHRSELSRLSEVLGEGLEDVDEEDLINEGMESARSMIQDPRPMSSFSSRRRDGNDMMGNVASSYSDSIQENPESKFTGRIVF